MFREAKVEDLKKGLWSQVNTFRFNDDELEDLGETKQETLFAKALQPQTKIYVLEGEDKTILGTAKLLIEPKLHHRGHPVAHIEDLVVNPAFRSKGIGSILLDHLKEEATKAGCYKILLNATTKVHGFYLKNGFSILGHEMGIRLID